MVVVKLIGGLGNQLFQYALGRHLALRNDALLGLDISAFRTYKLHRYGLDRFRIHAKIAEPREVEKFRKIAASPVLRRLAVKPSPGVKRFRGRLYVSEDDTMAFNPLISSLSGDIYLDGYWQSEKYFLPIKDVLRKELDIIPPPDPQNRRVAAEIVKSPSVSVHVRLADYATDARARATHGSLSSEYYERAVSRILRHVPDASFYLFSDEPAVAIERVALPPDRTSVIDFNGPDTNYEDLRLMSLCDHHIMANSTFSWWGSWMGRNPTGLTIAPANWFADEGRGRKTFSPIVGSRSDSLGYA